ncbi:heavy metal translocating P-type ATPase, partial [Acinetobacter baumannii]
YHRLREMAALIELSLLGAWIERLFQKKTGEAADKLMRRVPTTARVLRSGREATVTLREVQAGEFIVVEAGEQVPLDGEIVDGHSRVEESAWTG